MAHARFTRWQKASALLPLALLSGAWTTSLTIASSAETSQAGKLPDGSSVPAQTVKAPASVSNPGEIAPGVPVGSAGEVIKNASANGIPAAALSAYQRASQIIDRADTTCQLDWTLIAAIGRVESNHGRYGNNTLTSKGVSRPGIYGVELDGKNGTQKIADTDDGRYDHDTQYDRAVGPMQFIPSTWAVIGVDGDGDGQRDPQDINDAALATAVYLCSGKQDLSSTQGQRSAVYRYNHSNDYVDLVLSIMKAYASGDYSSVPTSSGGSTTFTPDYGDSVMASGTSGYHYPKGESFSTIAAPPSSRATSGSRGGSSTGTTTTSGGGTTTSSGGGGTTTSSPGLPTGSSSSDPTQTVKKTVKKVVPPVKKVVKPVPKVLITTAQATAMCTSALKSAYGSAPASAVSTCANDLQGKTVPEAQAAVGGIAAGLKGVVCGLLPLGC